MKDTTDYIEHYVITCISQDINMSVHKLLSPQPSLKKFRIILI